MPTVAIRSAEDIVERIMTAHWDMAGCRCWVCKAGRKAGCRPREKWLDHENRNSEVYPVPSSASWVWLLIDKTIETD